MFLPAQQLNDKTYNKPLTGADTPGTQINWTELSELVDSKKHGYVQIQTAIPGELQFAAYCRNSKGETLSVMDQAKMIPAWERELSAKYGKQVRITHFYWDRTSAWTRPDQEPPFRPAWQMMNRHLLEQKLYDGSAAWEQSRYSRDLMEPLNFIHEMTRRGLVAWCQAEGERSTRDMGGFFQSAASSATNEDYSRATSRRIRSKRAPKNQLGFYVGGGFPTGYTLKGITYAEDGSFTAPKFPRTDAYGVTEMGKIMEPREGWAATVRKLYTLLVEEDGSLADAADILVAGGWIPKNDDRSRITGTARYCLTNPILAGYLTHNDSAKEDAEERRNRNNRYRNYKLRLDRVQKDSNGNMVQGVDPVLTLEEYLDLQRAISKRTFARAPKVDVLLRRLVKCGKCGRTCSRRTATGVENGTYSCNGVQTKECSGVSIRLDMLEEYVSQKAIELFDADNLRREHEEYERQMNRLTSGGASEAQEIEKLRRQLEETIDAIMPDLSSVLRDAYEKKAEKLAARIEELVTAAGKIPTAPDVTRILPSGDLSVWADLEFAVKHEVLSTLIEGVMILPVGKGKARVMNNPEKLKAMLDERVVIWWKGKEQPASWNLLNA